MTETCLQREARKLAAKVAPWWGGDPVVVRRGPSVSPGFQAAWEEVHRTAHFAATTIPDATYGTYAVQAAAMAVTSLPTGRPVKTLGPTMTALMAAGYVATALAARAQPADRQVLHGEYFSTSYCRRRRRVGKALAARLERTCPAEVAAVESGRRPLPWRMLHGPADAMCPPLQAQFD